MYLHLQFFRFKNVDMPQEQHTKTIFEARQSLNEMQAFPKHRIPGKSKNMALNALGHQGTSTGFTEWRSTKGSHNPTGQRIAACFRVFLDKRQGMRGFWFIFRHQEYRKNILSVFISLFFSVSLTLGSMDCKLLQIQQIPQILRLVDHARTCTRVLSGLL